MPSHTDDDAQERQIRLADDLRAKADPRGDRSWAGSPEALSELLHYLSEAGCWVEWMHVWADTRMKGSGPDSVRGLAEATASEFQLYDYYDQPLGELFEVAKSALGSRPRYDTARGGTRQSDSSRKRAFQLLMKRFRRLRPSLFRRRL